MPILPNIEMLVKLLPQNFSISGIDILLALLILAYAFEGYSAGFVNAFLDLACFVLSFILGIKFYALFSSVLIKVLALPPGVAHALSFFVIAFCTEIIASILLRKLAKSIQKKGQIEEKGELQAAYLKTIDRISGTILGIASSVTLLAFILTVMLAFPFSSVLKHAISTSKIATILVSHTQGLEKAVNNVFGQAIDETINFFTIKPQSDEIVSLNFKTAEVSVDTQAEHDMLAILNKERTSAGLSSLVMDDALVKVARAHGRDMFARGYFSHYTPEGYSPFDRLASAGISYAVAGENLALAPNTALAMQGLMNSPGHRKNILSSDFGRVGIGVLDGGMYGEMFVQEFTN